MWKVSRLYEKVHNFWVVPLYYNTLPCVLICILFLNGKNEVMFGTY